MTQDALFDRALALLGPNGATCDPDIIAPHLVEWRGYTQGQTPFMARPCNTEQVAALVRLCAEAGAAITPQGGNTGLVGGQIPQGEVLLSLERMRAIRDIDPVADAMTVEAGAILTSVHEAAHGAGRHFPLSLASQGSATIGGLISTNAGGVHVVRYGVMRDLVLGVEAVLPDGSIFHGLNSLRKNNTGYDLKHLFIGGEGSLGVITAATLKLFPRPQARIVAMAALNSADLALDLLARAKASQASLAAFELMNRYAVELTVPQPGVRFPLAEIAPFTVLLEFESAAAEGLDEIVQALLADAMEANIITDAAVAQSEQAAADFWRLRETMPNAHKLTGLPQLSLDTVTPVSAVPEFLRRGNQAAAELLPGANIVAFGHMGDGNIHFTTMAPTKDTAFPQDALNERLHDLAVGLGGAISAEHGIGVFRKGELARFKDPAALATMRAVKRALDPKGIMNPRVLFV